MNPALLIKDFQMICYQKGGVKITIRSLQRKIPLTPLIRTAIRKTILDTFVSQEAGANPALPQRMKISSRRKGGAKPAEVTVCLVNDKKMAGLNLRYLGRRGSTDVMAFDLSNRPGARLADIIVSAGAAVSNSKIFKTTPLYELCLYAAHGALHLLGYDDADAAERRIMQKKAERILAPTQARNFLECQYIKPKP